MNNVENLILKQPTRYGSSPITESQILNERERLARIQNADDFREILDECSAQILSAVRHGDQALIGRVVLAAFHADINRRAESVLGLDPDRFLMPEDAAIECLLAASIRSAS